MDKSELLESLLDLAVDNTLEDIGMGKYPSVNPDKPTAALALILEDEFFKLVDSSGRFDTKVSSPEYWSIKQFFEQNFEDALLGGE